MGVRIFWQRSIKVYFYICLVSFNFFSPKIVSLQIKKWNKNANSLQLNCLYVILLAMCFCGAYKRRTFIFFHNLKNKSPIDYFLSTRSWKNDRRMMTSIKWTMSLQVNTESRATKYSQQLLIHLQICAVLHVIIGKETGWFCRTTQSFFFFFFFLWTESIFPSEQKRGFKVWIQVVCRVLELSMVLLQLLVEESDSAAHVGELSKSFEETLLGFPLCTCSLLCWSWHSVKSLDLCFHPFAQ